MAKPPTSGFYEVGFGKPPVECQFAKGRSGNPKGRPKKKPYTPPAGTMTDSAREILDNAKEPIKLRTADSESTVSSLGAVLQATKAKALKGSPAAQKVYLDQVERAQRSDNERWATLCKHVNHLKDRHEIIVAEVKQQGLSDKIFVPHPDDIELNHTTRDIDIHGPYDWETQRGMEEVIALRRDLLCALWPWSQIRCDPGLAAYITERIAARWNTMHIFNFFLPARHHLPPLAEYVDNPPDEAAHGGDAIIYGVIQPVPPRIVALFKNDPAADLVFFAGSNFMSASVLVDDRFSRYWRPTAGQTIKDDHRLRLEAALERATTETRQRQVLDKIAHDRTLPCYVTFNAQQSIAIGERKGASAMMENFRGSLCWWDRHQGFASQRCWDG